jgi:Flp pilus assembly protein TadB
MNADPECCASARALRLAISKVGVNGQSAQTCTSTLFRSIDKATRETSATRHRRSGLALLLLGVLHVLVLPTVVVVRVGVGVVIVVLRLADEPQRREGIAATPLKAPSVLQQSVAQ